MEWPKSLSGERLSARRGRFRDWICVAFFLFALNAFSLNFGCISPAFSRLSGFLALIGAGLLYMPEYSNLHSNLKIRKDLVQGMGLIVASLAILFGFSDEMFWIASLPTFIAGLDLILKGVCRNPKELSAISLGSLIYASFYIVCIHFPQVLMMTISLSRHFSGLVGTVAGTSLDLGPSVSGAWIFLTFFSTFIAFFLLSQRKEEQDDRTTDKKTFLWSITGLLAAYTAYILVHATGWMTPERAIHSLYIPFSLFLVPFFIFAPNFRLKEVSSGTFLPKRRLWPFLLLFSAAIILITADPYEYNFSGEKVLFYEKNCEMRFDLPAFPEKDQYIHPYDGFSVGALGLYLECLGYKVNELKDTDSKTLKEALKEVDLLVMMNLAEPLGGEDLETVWSFVKEGGGLLVFGEHTRMFVKDDDFEAGRDYLNEVLSPTGIKIRPDTADYVLGNWEHAVTSLPHPATRDLTHITTTSVGATLDLSGDARPLFLSRYGFSDDPNPKAQGRLGNRTYDKGETLGDLVLAASDTYGEGKVLVFGDTSYVFNSGVPKRYRLVENSITWLMGVGAFHPKTLDLAGLALLSSLGFIFLSLRFFSASNRSKISNGSQISNGLKISTKQEATFALILVITLTISGAINGLSTPSLDRCDNIAWIDRSHVNEFDLAGYNPGSIDGLTTNLMRNGYMPLIFEDGNLSETLEGDVLVIIAPTKPYSRKEADMIGNFVESSGLLIISSGYTNEEPLEPVLDLFDFDIGKIPLGSPPWIVETHGQGTGTVVPEDLAMYWHKPKFMEAHPVWSEEDYEPIVWLEYEGSGYNLIAARPFGEGTAVLIGDSHFLLNENLEHLTLPGRETREQYQLQWLGNIELLRGILAKYGREKQ